MFEDFDIGGAFDKALEVYTTVQNARHRGHPRDTAPAQPLADAPGQIPTGIPASSGMSFTIPPAWIAGGLVALVALVLWSRRK